MVDRFNNSGGRPIWRRNFTVELPDGTNEQVEVQVDVTKEPNLWQKNGKTPNAIRYRLDRKEVQKRAKLCADSPVTDGNRTVNQTCVDFLIEGATPIAIKGGEKRTL